MLGVFFLWFVVVSAIVVAQEKWLVVVSELVVFMLRAVGLVVVWAIIIHYELLVQTRSLRLLARRQLKHILVLIGHLLHVGQPLRYHIHVLLFSLASSERATSCLLLWVLLLAAAILLTF